jgi:hypothetical protein
VNPSFISTKAAAMAMYEYIIGEMLPRDVGKARDYATRMAELALTRQDFDLVQDLRELNGRVESPLFDAFWSELKIPIESHARVDDRRHGESTTALHCTALHCTALNLLLCDIGTGNLYVNYMECMFPSCCDFCV